MKNKYSYIYDPENYEKIGINSKKGKTLIIKYLESIKKKKNKKKYILIMSMLIYMIQKIIKKLVYIVDKVKCYLKK